jgi:hypothetical protein
MWWRQWRRSEARGTLKKGSNVMNELFREDMAKRPRLFHLNGPIPCAELDAWLSKRNLTVPDDLREVWCETGGGDVDQTETILGPYGNRELADDVDSVNEFHWRKGMPADWLIFHTGLGGLTVVKMSTGEYANVQHDSFEVEETFNSFADWYEKSIRPAFPS